ncbi:NAD-dependent epimerase/dehydratase family protein [Mycobacterium sp. PS03-16]|uniref:NAD-dependent epimerase/dehydratase family protein n=1 Tax=Mycobacterium sp. PS03-16 TaxID=2559611 RepID=UPI001073DA1C|nr:NAD-dependent epimerase/dehydratase family protein [Mycobacterium sp. PS03-16]TFV60300.1 NAD-dependent epimerase/dehydratase family protein [Mycobacterium sp. PS03-16]
MGDTPARRRALVLGASGNVGAAVTRRLVDRGDEVRVLVRHTSSTRGIDGLDVQRCYGDIFDTAAVVAAMADRDVVFYCVVDTRAHLADPGPLFRTNVEGLRGVLDIAVTADLQRFVFLSTIGTIAVGADGQTVTEDTPVDWPGAGGPYIDSCSRAEDLVLRYARDHGLPAAFGRAPVYLRGVGAEVVGIDDAAEALVLAAERGRVGERYIVSERYMTHREMFTVAAQAVGARPPRFGVPMALVYVVAALTGTANRLLGTDFPLNTAAARLLAMTSPADHGKAVRDLGWHPGPAPEAIRRAARCYVERRARGEKVIDL